MKQTQCHTEWEGQHPTDLLGHSEKEVAVSALLCPCPHEARLGAGRSGAELHGAFSFSSSSPCTAAAAPAAGSGRGLACPLSILFSPHHTASHIQLCLLRLPAEKRGKGGGRGAGEKSKRRWRFKEAKGDCSVLFSSSVLFLLSFSLSFFSFSLSLCYLFLREGWKWRVLPASSRKSVLS